MCKPKPGFKICSLYLSQMYHIFFKTKKEKKESATNWETIKREWKEAWLTERAMDSINLQSFFCYAKTFLLRKTPSCTAEKWNLWNFSRNKMRCCGKWLAA
jgi:hypothetical protein